MLVEEMSPRRSSAGGTVLPLSSCISQSHLFRDKAVSWRHTLVINRAVACAVVSVRRHSHRGSCTPKRDPRATALSEKAGFGAQAVAACSRRDLENGERWDAVLPITSSISSIQCYFIIFFKVAKI